MRNLRWLFVVLVFVGFAVIAYATTTVTYIYYRDHGKIPEMSTLGFVFVLLASIASTTTLVPLVVWPYVLPRRLFKRGHHIKRAPGAYLIALVTFLYSPNDVEKTFNPTLVDWRLEHFEALRGGKKWKASWINMRYRYRFVTAMGLHKIWKTIDVVVKAVTSAFPK